MSKLEFLVFIGCLLTQTGCITSQHGKETILYTGGNNPARIVVYSTDSLFQCSIQRGDDYCSLGISGDMISVNLNRYSLSENIPYANLRAAVDDPSKDRGIWMLRTDSDVTNRTMVLYDSISGHPRRRWLWHAEEITKMEECDPVLWRNVQSAVQDDGIDDE